MSSPPGHSHSHTATLPHCHTVTGGEETCDIDATSRLTPKAISDRRRNKLSRQLFFEGLQNYP